MPLFYQEDKMTSTETEESEKDVDCIVCASNEHLMHGGGVAAAISEAAGYQFDLASRDYVQKNGPIPVGRCCVTHAGKLPYKCVIHAIGPDFFWNYKTVSNLQ
uniref:Uncharacterized protein n=1 Tax=Magallana gigas TaxID=29159 RepID=K1PXH2_MAGGI